MTRKPGLSVALQLSLLEAKTGSAKPSISWCESAIHKGAVLRRLAEHEADPIAAINRLRLQKIEAKLYHVQRKILPKEMKKVKAFGVQRIVKKIKQVKSSDNQVLIADLPKLEVELSQSKALDHQQLSELAFSQKVLKGNPYVLEKLTLLGYKMPEFSCPLEPKVTEKLTNSKSYVDAVRRIQGELEVFLRKLLHEEVKPVKAAPKPKRERREPTGSESVFVSSLNAEESEPIASGPARVAFSDDDSDCADFESDEEENRLARQYNLEVPEPKRKNRMGQLARRRLAERTFGKSARHLQNGGLSVKAREEARVKKYEERQKRWAKYKELKARSTQQEKMAPRAKPAASSRHSEPPSNQAPPAAARVDPKMHPSWAAKMQQQNKLNQAQFQGQKIKFSDMDD